MRETIWIPRHPDRPFIAGAREERPDTTHAVAGGRSWLFGLMQGHWDIPPESKNDIVAPDGAVNLGIAIVVPAKMIAAVLDGGDLVAMRDRESESLRRTLAAKDDVER